MSTREHGPLSRREIVGAGGASLAAAAAGPAFAQGEAPSTQATRLVDPQDKYPRPPFKRQSQPWPGLASRMDPRPDHGEKTYRGSGRLAGRKALVTGGDSGMGRAAAIAFAREGADVAINHLPEEEPDAREVIELVRQEGRIGLSLPGDLRDEAFCKRLVDDALRGLGGLDILVMNAGRQQSRASILDISTDDFDATMKTNIYAPFWIIKAALPHLPPGSAIVATTSEQAYDPSPDLYDYAQTKAATMNYVKSLAKQLASQGHPRQRRRARSNLDAAASQRRRDHGEAGKIRRPDFARPSGPARRTRFDLRATRSRGRELCDRSGVRLLRRDRPAVKRRGRRPAPPRARSRLKGSERWRASPTGS